MLNLEGKRVLVVDDDTINLQVAKEYLEEMGASATIESDARRVVGLVEAHDFDALVFDIEMPFFSGYELAEKIREASAPWAKLPILVLSGRDKESEAESIRRSGINVHLTKPLDFDILNQYLGELLDVTERCEADALEPADGAVSDDCLRDWNPQAVPDSKPFAGFNLPPALKRIRDNWPMLRSLIVSFCNNECVNIDAIVRLYEQGQAMELERGVHRIKGTAATVGAERLAYYADTIEQSLREGDWPDETTFQKLRTALVDLHNAGKALSAEPEKTVAVETQCNRAEFLDLCGRIAAHLDTDLGYADEQLEVLMTLAAGTDLDKTAKNINHLFLQFKLSELQGYLALVNSELSES